MLNRAIDTLQKVCDKHRAHRLSRNERSELSGSFPELVELADELECIKDEYCGLHTAYIRDVSDSHNAVSLHQVSLLAWIVRKQPFKKIMDTGSGFSSFVLRREAVHKTGVIHYAVEDNEFWLGRTRKFLQEQKLPAERLVSWEMFQADTQLRDFDFVFHDMGNMTTRILSLPEIERRTTPNAWLLLDDTHKPAYYPHVLRLLGERWIVQSLVNLTMDEHDRYACICRRKQ